MKLKNLIIFDLDGVIIDVSMSYRETIRQSTKLFFKGSKGWKNLPDPLFSLSELESVKQGGGLNNDWDLTCLVISLLFPFVKTPTIFEDKDNWERYKKTIQHSDVSALAEFLKSTQQPLTALLEERGTLNDEFVQSLYVEDVGSGNIIKQIFQEIYLGNDLFQSTYSIPAKFYTGEGYMNRENLLIDKSILKKLSAKSIMAIATGRPEAEAFFALDFFDIKKYFTYVYTLDDCLKEEKRVFNSKGKKVALSKPNPYMLDAIKERSYHAVSKWYYVGDMPNDMIAASRSKAGFIGIGVLKSATDKDNLKKELLRAGADHIIEDIEKLEEIVWQKPILPFKNSMSEMKGQ